jgi:hypothetical protein
MAEKRGRLSPVETNFDPVSGLRKTNKTFFKVSIDENQAAAAQYRNPLLMRG